MTAIPQSSTKPNIGVPPLTWYSPCVSTLRTRQVKSAGIISARTDSATAA